VRRTLALAAALACPMSAAPAERPERVIESVVPALAYGTSCTSSVELQNLGDRPVAVEVEGHRESGALVPPEGRSDVARRLAPHERASYKLGIEEETAGAWIRVREKVPSQELSPVIAVHGTTECVSGNQLRSASREVAYPTRNPWFDADTAEMRAGVISLINTSERPVRASGCYSSGGLYSNPAETHRATELLPVCSASFTMQVPPFGSRQFAVAREGSSHFSLRTEGSSIVLQMLRPLAENVRIYAVDSTIQFGSEVR
jgi:hypothetical protein